MSVGLRERKKQKTRTTIQREAMRLFLEKGYEDTTIEDIAEAVEISPSTFFNYFPSKEEVVFADELDPLVLDAFNAQPPDMHPVAALRHAMTDVFSRLTPAQETLMRQRIKLMATTPELRAAMMAQFAQLVDQIADVLALRLGRDRNDFAVHNISGAVLGALLAAMIVSLEDPRQDMLKLAEQSLAHLEAGLPIDWTEGGR